MIGGLVYGYVVFMILPIYASLERMDGSLIEAGRDLYGSSLRTFFTVTVPASRAGAYAGLALVFLPAMGDFISAQLLGGPDNLMIGNLIQDKFFAGQNWPLGAALTMALMVLLLICMFAYLRQTARDAKEATPMTTLVAGRTRACRDRRRTPAAPAEGLGHEPQAPVRHRGHRGVLRPALPADLRGGAVLLQQQEVADRLRGLVAALVRGVLQRRRADQVAADQPGGGRRRHGRLGGDRRAAGLRPGAGALAAGRCRQRRSC